MTEPLKIGVLGAAKISGQAILQPALDTDGVEVTVIASRDVGRAHDQADEYSIAEVLDSYEAVLASDVDAVYNPLPISLHHQWTVAALLAGKHVLCEKPFASNAFEAADMVSVAEEKGLVAMEAFHWRYHPLAARIRSIVDGGTLGLLTQIDASFTVPIPADDDVRQSWELSGGALMDLGCYPVQWVRFVAGTEPTVTAATMIEGRRAVDLVTDIDLRFGEVASHVHTSMHPDAPRSTSLTVYGSDGVLHVDNPIAPHSGHQITIRRDGRSDDVQTVEGRTTYHHQLEAFRDAVVSGIEVPTGGDDAIANMVVIDAAYTAAGLPLRGTSIGQ